MDDLLYELISVLRKRADGSGVVYSCFKRLVDEKFCVQSSSGLYKGNGSGQWVDIMKENIDLFLDDSLDERGGWFETLELAIAEHERGF